MKDIKMDFSKQFENKLFCVRTLEDDKIVTYIGRLIMIFNDNKFGFLDVRWTDNESFSHSIDNEIVVTEHDEFTLLEDESEMVALVI